jgi:hypothetical protein
MRRLKLAAVAVVTGLWFVLVDYLEIGNAPLRVLLTGAFALGISMMMFRVKFKDLRRLLKK